MIVACPACDARYDVAGRPVGTRARCRCGTIFTIEEASGQAGLLACPRCGAGVPESSASCAYCHAHLLVKACPRCLARVFHGHKHCPECGGELDVAATGASVAEHAAHPPRGCPRCHVALIAHLVGDVAADDCPKCGGTFLDRSTLERVLGERREARAEAILGAYGTGGDTPLPAPPGPMYVKCPDCGVVMNRKQFARGAHVVVDVCRAHGTWFDAHELPRIVRFVATGGLERAAMADVADEREAARRTLEKARALAHMPDPSVERSLDRTSLLADILINLWR